MLLSDLITLAATIVLIGIIAGVVGGAVGYGSARLMIQHVLRVVEIQVEVVAASKRIIAPAEIQLRVRVPDLDPVTVPIITAPTPTARELAERVLSVYPTIGPTDLAEIVGCAKSTAHGILEDWRTTHNTPATADHKEISTWPASAT